MNIFHCFYQNTNLKALFAIFFLVWMMPNPSVSYAQSFRGGIRGGMTASEVSGDHARGPNKLGWFASVFTDHPLTDFSFLHLELMYIQKGSRDFKNPDDPEQGRFREYRFYLQYIEVPVLYKVHMLTLGHISYSRWLTGEIGLSLSGVIGHFETNDFGVDITDDMARDRPFNPVELNLLLGIQVPISEMLGVHVRLNQGVSPLRDHASGKKVWYNQGQYNTVWSAGLSLTLF